GTLIKKFIYGVGIDEVLKGLSPQGTVPEWYYHYDGLGSVIALINSAGAVIEKYEYDVFGNTIIRDSAGATQQSSSAGNRFMFTGRELDSETGLYYYRARYYSPQIGRFLQRDPVGYAVDINLYRYCNNNPLNWVDPWGLCKDEVRIGHSFIGVLPILHTGIIIISSEFGTRSWGFNPEQFSWKILIGMSVPGRIYINEDYSFSYPISTDKNYVRNLYQHLKSEENKIVPDYDLFGLDVNNCYTWRNRELRSVYFDGRN
ncbi:MAG: RHS repeat-associated core domain-containing protein, partial [Candidatus Omnitrophica bacterium]|nr:RHS repeat-associated core domain-containing protein [Candidatus Omnitrophota bacterium]